MSKEKRTSDMVLLHQDYLGDVWVLLVLRKHEPFAGMWAVPGGFVDHGESHLDAAVRELGEETNLPVTAADLEFVGRYDAPGRDPRGAVVSEAFLSVLDHMPTPTAADDARDARWWMAREAQRLAFDHERILRDALRVAGS